MQAARHSPPSRGGRRLRGLVVVGLLLVLVLWALLFESTLQQAMRSSASRQLANDRQAHELWHCRIERGRRPGATCPETLGVATAASP